MSTQLKQIGGQVRIDTGGRNFGYFDRSQVEVIFNPLSKTVSITCQGAGSINTADVSAGGVLSIETVTGGLVDITSQALWDTNFALLFPNEGGGSTTIINAGLYTPNVISYNGNISSATPKNGFYQRINDIVFFSFIIDVEIPVAPASFIGLLYLDIPVNSTFISILDATGNGNSETNYSQCYANSDDTTPNQIALVIPEIIVNTVTRYYVTTSYQIL